MMINDVITGNDPEEIRCELQEKLSIVTKENKKNKKKMDLRNKRHRSMTSRNTLRILLSNQLKGYYRKIDDVSSFTAQFFNSGVVLGRI